MSTAVAQSESQFASTFLTLLSVSESTAGLSKDYKKDLRELSGIGVKLPNLPITKKSLNSTQTSSNVYKFTIKSIKAPKFNVTLDAASTDTIYQLKTKLCTTADLKGYEPSSIKLLLKGKVLQDGSLVSDVTSSSEEELKVTALIGAKPEAPATVQPETTQERELPWDQIKDLLEAGGFDGDSTITRLQRGWRLTQ
ncbi:CYFA0S28e01002g1_1 [Cyberlindnera fabianii]|uniref:CYFA0S28e01002g1_1 n=1 Tax=Cyberlindnera fabianii TaxID=36022 RepID=A0A061BCQ9_CYBFA|nr:Ubiquitin-like protein MDY2 [Cyberlindnera fabianii]CDR47111.1 CYFA0S28e01002g1_1 [Cyberlindnera fabianii]